MPHATLPGAPSWKRGAASAADTRPLRSVNHAMLLTGFNDKGTPNWRLQNSWGSGWGDAGYMNMLRDDAITGPAGECGVQSYALLPRVKA